MISRNFRKCFLNILCGNFKTSASRNLGEQKIRRVTYFEGIFEIIKECGRSLKKLLVTCKLEQKPWVKFAIRNSEKSKIIFFKFEENSQNFGEVCVYRSVGYQSIKKHSSEIRVNR